MKIKWKKYIFRFWVYWERLYSVVSRLKSRPCLWCWCLWSFLCSLLWVSFLLSVYLILFCTKAHPDLTSSLCSCLALKLNELQRLILFLLLDTHLVPKYFKSFNGNYIIGHAWHVGMIHVLNNKSKWIWVWRVLMLLSGWSLTCLQL